MHKRVVVALSGGVDSAVVALLLKEQGYEVIGLTGKMTCSPSFGMVVNNAKSVADKLGIEHYVFDGSKTFNEKVIKYFEESYSRGETPNPCIMCNKYIKWGELFDYAINKLHVDYFATGHYADIVCDNGVYKLYPASDEHKDQLYFLFEIDQKHLAKTLFPLSKYTKEEVKKIAIENNLPPKSAKESQDICFIKAPNTTKKYLNNIFEPKKGVFKETSTGKILGYHDGFWQYTTGQRKGIGLAAPEALYVTSIDSETNTVYVGYKDKLYSNELVLKDIHYSYPRSDINFNAKVKVRYNMDFIDAKVSKSGENWLIKFEKPVSAITKGQACVLYSEKDGHLIGGGWV